MSYGTLIQTVTVGAGGASTISFSSIPQNFTDLVLVVSQVTTRSSGVDQINLTFNGSAAGYTTRLLYGTGTGVGSETGPSSAFTYAYGEGGTSTANTFSNIAFHIPNYAGSANKSLSIDAVSEGNSAGGGWQNIVTGLWANTAAITSISLVSNYGANFGQYSTASLYGVTAGTYTWPTASIKATGGTIVQYQGYVYHVFTAAGTFTPTQALTADILVVAGGGGGDAGGGGAGGLLGFTGQSLTTTGYTITIGSGGNGTNNANPGAGNGTNSQFGALTAAVGGGGGGGQYTGNGINGGSGGGSDYGTGGTGVAGQGFAGGGGASGGSGGGATAAGGSGTGGGGGAGSSAYLIWAIATATGSNNAYAGGGAGYRGDGSGLGKTGGIGGGGNGGSGTGGLAPTAGTANTGGGGGGANIGYGPGKNGGSGIVIVRYQ
jgi:hypothetical protein